MKHIIWKLILLPYIFSDDVPDNLKESPDHEKPRAVNWTLLVFWLLAIAMIVFSIVYFFFRSTVFTVTANVEQVSISPFMSQKYPDLKFSKVKLHKDCGEDSTVVSGYLYPDEKVYIEFLRVQKGDLYINLDIEDSDSVGKFITEDNETIKLDDCASIRLSVNDAASHVFPIEGQIKLGGDIKEGSDIVPILYSGEVIIVDKAFVTRDYYSVGPFELKMGDIFVVDDLALKSSGFVQIDDDKGIKVTYSSKGSRGFIKKYKTESIEIKNGFWNKIYNDPSLIILWFAVIGFYKLSKTYIRINLNTKNTP